MKKVKENISIILFILALLMLTFSLSGNLPNEKREKYISALQILGYLAPIIASFSIIYTIKTFHETRRNNDNNMLIELYMTMYKNIFIKLRNKYKVFHETLYSKVRNTPTQNHHRKTPNEIALYIVHNYHWDDKNYSDELKEILEMSDELLQITLDALKGLDIILSYARKQNISFDHPLIMQLQHDFYFYSFFYPESNPFFYKYLKTYLMLTAIDIENYFQENRPYKNIKIDDVNKNRTSVIDPDIDIYIKGSSDFIKNLDYYHFNATNSIDDLLSQHVADFELDSHGVAIQFTKFTDFQNTNKKPN